MVLKHKEYDKYEILETIKLTSETYYISAKTRLKLIVTNKKFHVATVPT